LATHGCGRPKRVFYFDIDGVLLDYYDKPKTTLVGGILPEIISAAGFHQLVCVSGLCDLVAEAGARGRIFLATKLESYEPRTGPAELQGKCLVLFFVKTADGWRNYSLRASMDNVPLSEHMANLKKGIEKEDAGASTPKPDGSPADDVSKAAVSAAEKWLAAIDAGNYSLTWKDASAFFQAAVTEQAWNTSMENFRKPLGDLVSRKLKSAQQATSLPGAPDGEYVVMQFDTLFAAQKTAVETVTFTHEKAG